MSKKNHYRINEQIRAPELRVLDDTGKMLGLMSKDEALSKAKELGVDLIEIAPNAVPPVAKIIELGKFNYLEEKRLRQQKKKSKVADLKEVRFSPFIADGDYMTRIRKMDKFLLSGHKVRVVVVFKGRHMGSRDKGYDLMRKVLETLSHDVVVDMEPKFLGRHLAMVISPVKRKKADTKNAVIKEPKA